MQREDRVKFDRNLDRVAHPTDPNAPPAWWTDDADAMNSGLAAARAMGINPDLLMLQNSGV